MYKVYARHFKPPVGYPVIPGQTIVEDETLMYDLPAIGSDPDDILIDPKVKDEMGKAGSFEFSMEQNNPWYSSLLQMTTLMRVVYDDETIFYGRVLAIDTDIYGKRQVHCEGALAFLLDTLMEATKEEERETITIVKYLSDLITSHNRLLPEDPAKHFELGEVPGHYSLGIPSEMKPDAAENRKFGTGSWTSTLNCLEDLTSKYGGYLRARYNDNDGKIYLDWFRNYFNPTELDQPLKVSENIINFSGTVDVNGIFTVLIPEGSKNGDSLYLDKVPKTIVKIPLSPQQKDPVGPGYDPWWEPIPIPDEPGDNEEYGGGE